MRHYSAAITEIERMGTELHCPPLNRRPQSLVSHSLRDVLLALPELPDEDDLMPSHYLDAVFKRLRDKGLADLCLEATATRPPRKRFWTSWGGRSTPEPPRSADVPDLPFVFVASESAVAMDIPFWTRPGVNSGGR